MTHWKAASAALISLGLLTQAAQAAAAHPMAWVKLVPRTARLARQIG